MGANFAKRHKPVQGDEHVAFLTDPHEWYRHPAIRLFILFMILFMDFFVYGQDPAQDSAVETTSLGCGQIVGMLAIWFAPNWQHSLGKAVCLVVSLILAYFFGMLINMFMVRVVQFTAFKSGGGKVTSYIIGLAPAAFLVDAIYNATINPSRDDIYLINSHSMEFFRDVFHLRDTSYQEMGKMWQWISATLDWLSIFQIGDSIFQDTHYWPGFMPGFKKFYNSGSVRTYVFRFGFPLSVILTGFALNASGPNPGQFNWEISGIKGTSEVTRSACGAVIVFLDLFCLVQDWEFPLFSEAHKEEEHKAVIAGTEKSALEICGLQITAKWLQYGPLLGIMGADFAFVKSMFQYVPATYGQYVGPDYRVWTIQNQSLTDVIYPLGAATTNSTLLAEVSYTARHDVVTGGPLAGCDTCPFDTRSTAMFYDSNWDYAGVVLSVIILISFIIVMRRASKTAILEEIEVWDEKAKQQRTRAVAQAKPAPGAAADARAIVPMVSYDQKDWEALEAALLPAPRVVR